MNEVNKTLYIPLYGKAYVSRKGIILPDPKAEEIWAAEGFPLKGKSRSKWLAYFMGMRSAVFDRWVEEKMAANPGAIVLHLGCGMDSRVLRVNSQGRLWFDVDFPDVIDERKRYYQASEHYRMIPSDIRDGQWLDTLPEVKRAIVVMEGISMYLPPAELKEVFRALCGHFEHVCILMDCYTTFAAKASKFKNPINDVGVTLVYGTDNPRELEDGTDLDFLREHNMTPADLINQLHGMEKAIFARLYAGKLAQKMYRIYEYGGNHVSG
ncbi:MAG: class I SAM-dependent methyltransferase [Oscillospiraceae bacterium]|nr:class I SAM-dependent methyltransferase [Oscillospiraceae bacterium]